VLLYALFALLAVHVGGLVSDVATAIGYPFELDYGEGIVWQQGVLIPGPRMYSTSADLPFIVFQYPPLYYLLVHAAYGALADFLAAGRLVAALSMIPLSFGVVGLVIVATRRRAVASEPVEIAIALATGMLVLCIHAFHEWGMFMRVDLTAVALSMAGLLVASWAAGRFWGTTFALLLCSAAVFTRQTELPAAAAVFVIALLRNPRGALGAAAIAGSLCLAAIVVLELQTSGGFLLNVVSYNLNPMTLGHAFWPLIRERASLPIAILILIAFWLVGQSVLSSISRASHRPSLRELRSLDRSGLCRALLLLDFALLTLTLPALMKSGSNYNYVQDWLAVGCVLLGIALVDLWRRPDRNWMFAAAVAVLIATTVAQPFRLLHANNLIGRLAWQESVVHRIATASKPVASEDMVLLMRAGKQVMFEPVTATNLAADGVWDEGALVQMIRSHGFAFVITRDDRVGGGLFRSPAVDAAIREAYPSTERIAPRLWLRSPQS
jgi:hypothetical protein